MHQPILSQFCCRAPFSKRSGFWPPVCDIIKRVIVLRGKIQKKRTAKKFDFFKKNKKLIMIGIAAVVVLIGAIVLFSGPGEEKHVAIDVEYIEKQSANTIKVYDKSKDAVFEMNMEQYLKGVVAAEMPIRYEPEALKAQAVAARTYTYYKYNFEKCKRNGADICTDHTHCQAYVDHDERKASYGENYQAFEGKLNNAVGETFGEVMTYDGELILAFYHSTSGGRTEDGSSVFKGDYPYLTSVESPGEEGSSRFEAEKSFSYGQFKQAIAEKYKDVKLKNLKTEVAVSSRTNGGRVNELTVANKKIKGTEVRTMFKLDSANFEIKVTGDKVIFKTKGFGHGVGMSQVGANAMAKENKTYSEILRHYYSGINIENVEK